MKFLRLAILLLPAAFLGLTVVYKDFFYIFLALTSFLFSVLVIFPSILAKSKVVTNFKVSDRLLEEEEKVVKDVVNDLKNQKSIYNPRYLIGFLFLLSVLFFSYIAIYKLNIAPNVQNIFIEYFQNQLSYFKNFLLYLLIGESLSAYVLSIVFLKYKRRYKGKILFAPRYIPISLALVFIVLISGLLISFFTTYLFGVGEVNLIALKTKLYPSSTGMVIGKDDVINKLKDSKDSISIVVSDNDVENTIISQLILRVDEQNSFYLQRIIKTIPQSLTLPIEINDQPLVMISNTLIFNELNKRDIEAVSPIIGKVMATSYFKSRYLKEHLPKVTVMSRQDYLTFREKQIDEQVAKLDDAIQEVGGYISQIHANINEDRQKIAANQRGIQTASSQRDYYYNTCVANNAAGYYFYGTFYHTYIQENCDSNKSQWDQTIAQYQQNISDWNSTLQYDQKLLSDYQELSDYLIDIRDIVDSQRDLTPQELGIFEPTDNVKVALDSISPKAVENYLQTLAHEYLHYSSYISDNRQLDHFFEEGLTEYFARKTIKHNLGVDINLGYPLITKIIKQMTKKIPEKTLQDIYFTKDQSQLSALLDEAYGKNFYEDTQLYFTAISYAPPDMALKIANNIMYRIGGKELNEKDLYSSSFSN